MGAIITLTTDFGLTDAYVAAMKGVILGINPEVTLIDISHNIEPQNIRQAALILSAAYPYFPPGTVHLVVIDPGVGSQRRAIILSTGSAYFIAPDNGVLSYVITGFMPEPHQTELNKGKVDLPTGLKAVTITNPQYWQTPVSPTFHGRDIFSPVAAQLSLGVPLTSFGEEVQSVNLLALSRPRLTPDSTLVGHIQHIDGFGNLITDIKGDDLPSETKPLTIEVARQHISGISKTYADNDGLLALIGSSGYLEIALKDGSACSFLNAEVGNEVRLQRSNN